MKLPEVLKSAVENEDWQLVCDVYTNVTGLPLSPPQPKEMNWAGVDIEIDTIAPSGDKLIPNNHTLLKQLTPNFTDNTEQIIDESIASNLVADEGNNMGEYSEETTFNESKNSFIAPSQSGKPQQKIPNNRGEMPSTKQKMLIPKERINRFQDNLDAFSDERVDINSNMGVQKVSKRNDRGVNQVHMVDVVCSSCDKTQVVSETLAVGYSPEDRNNTYKCNECIVGRSRRE